MTAWRYYNSVQIAAAVPEIKDLSRISTKGQEKCRLDFSEFPHSSLIIILYLKLNKGTIGLHMDPRPVTRDLC
jgi:hypothetical protein